VKRGNERKPKHSQKDCRSANLLIAQVESGKCVRGVCKGMILFGTRNQLFLLSYYTRSRDSSVGIATGYGLDDQGKREYESRYAKKFPLLHIVQTGSGVHPTSYKMGTGGSFPGVKWQGREAGLSPPTSAVVKKMWIYISTPL
jgi:hypothetical protein